MIVETASQMILAIAAAVYLLPLLLFFAGYALGAVTELPSLLLGGVGFVVAIFAVVLLNRKISAKIGYHMIGFVEEL